MKENSGNVIKFPSASKCFNFSSLSKEEMKSMGFSKKDVAEISKRADKIADEIVRNAEKKWLLESEKEPKRFKFEVVK